MLKGKVAQIIFLNDTGTVAQNEEIMNLVANYALNNIKKDVLLSGLLSFGTPRFRVECMVESEPESCEFYEVTYDLIIHIIKKRDCDLMKKLYKYIDLAMYSDYIDEINAMMRDV